MAADALPDPATPFGARVRSRLTEEKVIWFTTVGGDGTPQPNPVWFTWHDDHIVVYNRPDAHRLTHVRQRSRVALHFDGDGNGGDIVVLRGEAHLFDDAPASHTVPEYLAKYRDGMGTISGSPEAFAAEYSVALRVQITNVRGF